MKRSLQKPILNDLHEKVVLLSGPRQVGKTTLAKTFFPKSSEYFNADRAEDRLLLQRKAWRRDCDLVIFDELHKVKKWKSWLKGIYDTEGVRPRILVSGSARLDVYRKGGDSLAGRFYSYRLHPVSVAEVKETVPAEEALDRIIRFGGFPEPFLKASEEAARRWRRSHADTILREDVVDLTFVRDLKGLETLVERLRQSVGSPVSYESLARDLQVSSHTVKHWIAVLESLYLIFMLTPYSKNVARSLLKQPKIYFYDTGLVKDDPAARLENTVACALLKRLHFLEDVKGEVCGLHYLKDKERREVDFACLRNGKLECLVETKWSDPDVSNLHRFSKLLPSGARSILLLKETSRELFLKGVYVKRASAWLQELEA